MISRYNQEDIAKIWSLQSKYEFFLDIEKSICRSLTNYGIIPRCINAELESVKVDLGEITEIEKSVKHDLIAFTTSIENQLSSKTKQFFHYGVTSSDVIDTALMMQMRASVQILIDETKKLLITIKEQIGKSSDIICAGRTHGVFAEPMVFAQKWLSFYAELKRRLSDLENIYFTGQISGAIGTHSIINQELEKEILIELNLSPEPQSTQVIPRDRFLSIVSYITHYGTFFERLSVEFRHLQHSDIDEVYEGFSCDQRGSSIMPHKKNPISFENITGVSRVISSYYHIAYSNCSLWHERDLSHSSAERIYLPDLFNLVCYGLRKTNETIKTLHYDRDKIQSKVFNNPSLFSSSVLHEVLQLSSKSRSDVYKIVQKSFFQLKEFDEIVLNIQKELDIPVLISVEKILRNCKVNFDQKYKNLLEECL